MSGDISSREIHCRHNESEVNEVSNWINGFQESIDYIEKNLDGSLDIEDIAAKAALSSFYYQRIFSAMCDMTVGDYIRSRRMTLAAQELSSTDAKVIDVALKYGYDSPDSFAKAFSRFHGIAPSKARETGAKLRSIAPLHIKISMEGGKMLDYQIVEKPQFTVMGVKRKFFDETSYQEVPKFWQEWLSQGEDRPVMGVFGLCKDMNGREFEYWIADLYQPWKDIPEGCETTVIPGGLWAVFTCRGPIPENFQKLNTQIWTEWLPNLKGYKLAGSYNLEVYGPPTENIEDYENYIWIPLVKE